MGTVRKCEVISFQFKIEVCRIGTNIIGFHGSEIKLCGRKVSFQACQQLLSRHVRKIAKKKRLLAATCLSCFVSAWNKSAPTG